MRTFVANIRIRDEDDAETFIFHSDTFGGFMNNLSNTIINRLIWEGFVAESDLDDFCMMDFVTINDIKEVLPSWDTPHTELKYPNHKVEHLTTHQLGSLMAEYEDYSK